MVDQGGILEALEDGLQVILHRQHKTGGQLPQRPAGVHQAGRIGQKRERGHGRLEAIRRGPHRGAGVEEPVRLGHHPGHPRKDIRRCLDGLSAVVAGKITFFEYLPGQRGEVIDAHGSVFQ